MTLVARRFALCLSAVLVGSLLGPASGPGLISGSAVGASPKGVDGSAGIEDRYYPFDGNGQPGLSNLYLEQFRL